MQIETFVKNYSKYPPAEIFAGVVNPTPKQKKAEKRLSDICEDLYKLEVQTLGESTQAYREFKVTMNMADKGFCVRPDHIINVVAVLLVALTKSSRALTECFKKDPLLVQYYSNWKPDMKAIESDLIEVLKQFNVDMKDFSVRLKEEKLKEEKSK